MTAAIALELSQSSICAVEDLWSCKRIQLIISPEPQGINRKVLEEIIMRSFDEYLRRPGHVELPDGMIPGKEFLREQSNGLLRVQKLWEY